MGKTWTLGSVAELAAANGYEVLRTTAAATLRGLAGAQRPHLVIVDDAHRLPAEQVRSLFSLARDLARHPVVVLLAAEAGGERTWLPADVRPHVLHPWSVASAAVLLRGQPRPVTGRLRHEVLRRARGNPRALVELAGAVATARRPGTDGPVLPDTLRIQRMYVSRLATLPELVRHVMLYAAARLGEESVAAVLRAGAAGPDGWAAAVDAGLVEDGRDLRFVDPLFAVALYDGTPIGDRRRVHQALAACELVPSFERAMHAAHARAAPDADVAARLERASAAARGEGRMSEAVLAAQLAAEMSTDRAQQDRRYVLAALAADAAGDSAWVRELNVAAGPIENPSLRLAMAGAMAMCHTRANLQRTAMDLLLRSEQAAPAHSLAAALGVATSAAVVYACSGLREHATAVARMRDTVRDRAAEAPARPDDTDARLAFIDTVVEPDAAARWAALLPGRGQAADPATTVGKHALAVVAEALSETPLAVRLWTAGLNGGRPGEVAAWPEVWPALAQALIRLGRWPEASAALDAAEELDDLQDLPLLRVSGTALRGTLAALRGDGSTARELGESVWPLLLPECYGAAWTLVIRTLALAASVSGDHETAFRHYRSLVEADLPVRRSLFGEHPVLGLAMAAQRLGRSAEAEPLVRSVRAAFGADPEPGIRLTLDHATALLDLDEHTGARFDAVVGDPHAARWPLEHALARLHFGAWLRRHRRPADARRQLSAAYTILSRLGAAGLAETARVELRASGGAPAGTSPERRAGSPDGWMLLSPQQREVTRLAAQGLRNREIAEQLGMSPRTVSSHLYNAYLRLGVTARHQLRGKLEL